MRPKANQASRCSRCQKRCPAYDGGDGIRRWRSLDLETTKTYLQAAAPRVACPEHGVGVAHLPWAWPGARHTWAFEDTAAWLTAHAALSVVAVFLRVAWRVIAAIVSRRWPRHQRPAGRADAHRHRRDRLPQRPPLSVLRHRSHNRLGWCGPLKAVTRTPWAGFSTSSAPNVPRR
ncbi:transposase family protein [Mycobacterium xenopi]|uniref:transposase family protein n=1 Tax=Mycobacterium xenopi TaxID=1789 RepID=UPI003A599251